jgi:peptidoglycan/xylan/chitin deacetylase (PgdA/CDA1 family)
MRLRIHARRSQSQGDGPVVLLYHRIDRPSSDPQLLCVAPEHFAEHIEMIGEHYEPMALGELVAAIHAGEPLPRGVAITFDDGYADNMYVAKPVLERNGVPATVFVASGWVGAGRSFWWDELETLLLRPGRLPPTLTMEIGSQTVRWELADDAEYRSRVAAARSGWTVLARRDPGPRQRIYRDLSSRLRALGTLERERALDSLRALVELHDPVSDDPLPRPLDLDELRRLVAGDLIDVGGHSVTHPVLSRLDPDSQREEIAGSKRYLEHAAGRAISSFAYPYGGATDFDLTTARIVRDVGFDHACANVPGRLERGTDDFRIPRVLVRDCQAAQLAERLSMLGTPSVA